MKVRLVLLVFLMACGTRDQVPARTEQIGTLRDPVLTESSGLAASHRSDTVLWSINDSGNAPQLHAIDLQGDLLGSVTVAGEDNQDWEDLAAFIWHDQAYLLIADVGDNHRQYDTRRLIVVPEPQPQDSQVQPAWTVSFQYPDGRRDCEAVAVDARRELVWLLSKRDQPPRLYTVPLRPEPGGPHIARLRLAAVALPQPGLWDLVTDPVYGRFGSQPTAMDLHPSGNRLVVATYKHLYLWQSADGHWAQALAAPGSVIVRPQLRQAESVCFNHDGTAILHGSEQVPSPLLRTTLPVR